MDLFDVVVSEESDKIKGKKSSLLSPAEPLDKVGLSKKLPKENKMEITKEITKEINMDNKVDATNNKTSTIKATKVKLNIAQKSELKSEAKPESSLEYFAVDNTADIVSMQPASYDIWEKKYQLRSKDDVVIDRDIKESYQRVAKAIAEVELPENRKEWEIKFLWALQNGAIPAGRIISNAGALHHKPATSTINCTVSGTISDSMDSILAKVHESGLTLKAGCGIGYEFSTLRPRGGYVAGAGAYTSGPLSFMDIYDKMCFTVSSAGGRRGAQMATFDISHPDVIDFIKAKREDGRLRQFNLSLLITDSFIKAVKNDEDWPLVFPLRASELVEDNNLSKLEEAGEIVWQDWADLDGKIVNDEGLVACRVYKKISARRIWNVIMSSTYDYAEPGFILIDKVNEMNNNWFCETIRATNPCGEQPLPPYGACLLGSVNLTKFVSHPFTDKACFDWDKYKQVIAIFTRMLDNVVEINGLPLEKQRKEILDKRRHGMGFLGLGSTMTMLKMAYGSAKSLEFTEEIAKEMALTGWKTGLELAKEKGAAPIMHQQFVITAKMLRQRPELKQAGYNIGDEVAGKVLLAKFSRYMQQIAKVDAELIEEIAENGCRFTHHSSIAPTGTISLSLANNASNGIEPSFAHHYSRNIIREGKKSKEKVEVYSYELLAYRHYINPNAVPFAEDDSNKLPDYFISADDINPEQHVDVQAVAQKWIDSSISKTANVPTDFDYEKFKDIYMYAYEKGLKGCTTFRFNPAAFSGVLVKEQDLANTTYQFTLEDGSIIEAKGNEEVEYDGEKHSAANLFDALKEGYYGRL